MRYNFIIIFFSIHNHFYFCSQKCNDLTGEHSCIMIRNLSTETNNWLQDYFLDFRKRFTKLLPKVFRKFSVSLGFTTISNSHIDLQKPGEFIVFKSKHIE